MRILVFFIVSILVLPSVFAASTLFCADVGNIVLGTDAYNPVAIDLIDKTNTYKDCYMKITGTDGIDVTEIGSSRDPPFKVKIEKGTGYLTLTMTKDSLNALLNGNEFDLHDGDDVVFSADGATVALSEDIDLKTDLSRFAVKVGGIGEQKITFRKNDENFLDITLDSEKVFLTAKDVEPLAGAKSPSRIEVNENTFTLTEGSVVSYEDGKVKIAMQAPERQVPSVVMNIYHSDGKKPTYYYNFTSKDGGNVYLQYYDYVEYEAVKPKTTLNIGVRSSDTEASTEEVRGVILNEGDVVKMYAPVVGAASKNFSGELQVHADNTEGAPQQIAEFSHIFTEASGVPFGKGSIIQFRIGVGTQQVYYAYSVDSCLVKKNSKFSGSYSFECRDQRLVYDVENNGLDGLSCGLTDVNNPNSYACDCAEAGCVDSVDVALRVYFDRGNHLPPDRSANTLTQMKDFERISMGECLASINYTLAASKFNVGDIEFDPETPKAELFAGSFWVKLFDGVVRTKGAAEKFELTGPGEYRFLLDDALLKKIDCCIAGLGPEEGFTIASGYGRYGCGLSDTRNNLFVKGRVNTFVLTSQTENCKPAAIKPAEPRQSASAASGTSTASVASDSSAVVGAAVPAPTSAKCKAKHPDWSCQCAWDVYFTNGMSFASCQADMGNCEVRLCLQKPDEYPYFCCPDSKREALVAQGAIMTPPLGEKEQEIAKGLGYGVSGAVAERGEAKEATAGCGNCGFDDDTVYYRVVKDNAVFYTDFNIKRQELAAKIVGSESSDTGVTGKILKQQEYCGAPYTVYCSEDAFVRAASGAVRCTDNDDCYNELGLGYVCGTGSLCVSQVEGRGVDGCDSCTIRDDILYYPIFTGTTVFLATGQERDEIRAMNLRGVEFDTNEFYGSEARSKKYCQGGYTVVCTKDKFIGALGALGVSVPSVEGTTTPDAVTITDPAAAAKPSGTFYWLSLNSGTGATKAGISTNLFGKEVGGDYYVCGVDAYGADNIDPDSLSDDLIAAINKAVQQEGDPWKLHKPGTEVIIVDRETEEQIYTYFGIYGLSWRANPFTEAGYVEPGTKDYPINEKCYVQIVSLYPDKLQLGCAEQRAPGFEENPNCDHFLEKSPHDVDTTIPVLAKAAVLSIEYEPEILVIRKQLLKQ